MNLWRDLNPKEGKNLNVVVEIPKLSRVKYEFDKESGVIKIDRFLKLPLRYPVNYGFIPRSLCSDGDPLDALVLSHERIDSGAVISVRPIGVLFMTDAGKEDQKILTVPTENLKFKKIDGLSDIDPNSLEEIKHFFEIYKDSSKKDVIVKNWGDRQKALEVIDSALELYKKKYEN